MYHEVWGVNNETKFYSGMLGFAGLKSRKPSKLLREKIPLFLTGVFLLGIEKTEACSSYF